MCIINSLVTSLYPSHALTPESPRQGPSFYTFATLSIHGIYMV